MINQILNNKALMKIDEIWTNALDFLGQAWWIEVLTTQPRCIYYFGPFRGAELANLAVSGYVEDLEGEAAQGIKTQVNRCHPARLTIEYDLDK
ncbi:DUF1816 domain-containing protein [Chamaesiphon sp.]|uniref:DUF1816 domain-containing protein n=1 Tax=Chamaesiphon sp. TaxID=2814140 RepID=UPI003594921E